MGLATGTSRDDRPAIARGDPLAETSGDGTGLAAQAGEAEGSLTLGDGVPRGLRVYTGPRTLIGPSAMGDLGRPRFSLRALRLARPPKRAYDGRPVAVRLLSGSGDAADRWLAGAARREPARVAEVCARYPVLSDRQMRAGRSVSPSNSSPCCRRSFVVSGRGLMSHFSSWSLALLRIARPERTASPPRS